MQILVEAGVNLTLVGADRRNPFKYVLQEQGDDGIELALYLFSTVTYLRKVRTFLRYVTAEKRSA